MSDLRELFPILEDSLTQEGKGWTSVSENFTASQANAGAVLAVKDESGKLQYIPMVDGKIPVTFESADIVYKYARGGHAGDKNNYQVLATINLINNKAYTGLEWVVSCYRDTHFEIVKIDDSTGTPVETVLADILTSAGCVTHAGGLKNLKFVAGATGTCILVVRAKNFGVASQMRATISIIENQ
jgi:hypothetical protein